MKKLLAAIYIIILLCMASATIVENIYGTPFAMENIYGAWWFTALWALLTATGIAHIIRSKMRKASALCLHASFIIILLGALLTHLTSYQGIVSINRYEKVNQLMDKDGRIISQKLPFHLKLKDFNIEHHAGTEAVADYTATFIVYDEEGTTDSQGETNGQVSMNNVFSHKGVRLYMSGYGGNEEMVYLAVNSDPWGIPVTYLGYALLFISLLWILIDPKGQYRSLLRQSRGFAILTIILIAAFSVPQKAMAINVLPKEKAKEMCRINILYNNRICPMETFAIDFTKKLYGSRSYKDFTAEQVLTGFLLFPDEWANEPMLRIKSEELQKALGTDSYASLADLQPEHNKQLTTLVSEALEGRNDALHKDAMKVEDMVLAATMWQDRRSLRIFPCSGTWFAPSDSITKSITAEQEAYITTSVPALSTFAKAHDWGNFSQIVNKIRLYQHTYGAESLPSPVQLWAEHVNNAIPLTTILAMLSLSLGFLSLVPFIRKKEKTASHSRRIWAAGSRFACGILLVIHSFNMALRWIISSTIPMSNGYETMLLMAWIVLAAAVIMAISGKIRKQKKEEERTENTIFNILYTFSLLLSGFFLLVSHISQMDPQITHIMPVLQSPLLTIHVSIIMTAYALLAITALCALWALLKPSAKDEMLTLSQLMLYPAMAALGIGIFVGAIWANVSWGTYWSWDPKETWALITFMLYALPLHRASLPGLQRPKAYHIYMLLAFLSVVFTYFGVNYLLSGMHSYA